MGAFATTTELLDRIGPLAASDSPAIRGAVLWTLQLGHRAGNDAAAIARIIKPMLDDVDPHVRRRAVCVDPTWTCVPSFCPAIRVASRWTLQLGHRAGNYAAAIARLIKPMLDDTDPIVRRRAAYVAGNLGLAELAPALVKRCDESEPP